ncbi:hypothetical protein EVG20_g4747 [Dentipellis fragilis]|uniref:RlpA-like protein double-psi beta-barrel domain-containing protein n=1 Tax=Dentipellis fragilis TaxID=205917 RepID=A0A4Y9YV80_9AGAM|nr:hypothetical protein EVG20_g4747 [Dentipellis fragilis]
MLAFKRLLALASLAVASVSAVPVRRSNSGQGTFFEVGVGACGITNVDTDLVVAVSQQLFDTFPGAGANPNANPICNKPITAHFQGKSVSVKVTDRCAACALNDLDFSPSAFSKLADQSAGRIAITWDFD